LRVLAALASYSMRRSTSGSRRAVRLAGALSVLVLLIGTEHRVSVGTVAQTDTAKEGWVLAVPERRVPDTAPVFPPALPAGANSVTPATLDIVIRRDTPPRGAHALRQTASRTLERIHIAGNDRREWLFERNPVDPRRVSATLVEHASQTIIVYEESDLRRMLGIRGWADVLSFGFDSQLLSAYERSEDMRTIGGIRFARYTSAGTRAPVDDVWWSDEQALPSRFSIADTTGVTRFAVERARAGADAALLRPASVRFPTYRVLELADWFEKH
jgi:hypothetical protein